MRNTLNYLGLVSLILFASCSSSTNESNETADQPTTEGSSALVLQAEDATSHDGTVEIVDNHAKLSGKGWLAFDLDITEAGRYKVEVATAGASNGTIWIEDYVGNPDDRTYDITGKMVLNSETSTRVSKDGSPLNSVTHPIRVHFEGDIQLDKIELSLLKPHKASTEILTQNMTGDEWEIAWSDEFDGTSIDTTKWVFDIGDWGWGNNELQYYTDNRPENARLEDGNLIIEARKNDNGSAWTSTRMTTRGKTAFIYGKIDIRAKVPKERGNWSAGWTLGNDYVDEKSWPYCGEIDIMESVGFEIDDETSNGKAHASIHCPAKYFKLNNQPTGIIDVQNMENEFHNYTLEWSAEGMTAFVDDEPYFTYDDTTDEMTWPYDKAQNIIINLAMGGGWGGAQGMDESVTSQMLVIDYVRVYERK